jgi:hypothetical protein
VRNNTTRLYRKYYALWVEFDILLSVFALTNLVLAMQNYDLTFVELHVPNSQANVQYIYWGEIVNMMLLVLCIMLLFFRQRMKSYWRHYRTPYSLLKVLVANEHRENQDPDANNLASF